MAEPAGCDAQCILCRWLLGPLLPTAAARHQAGGSGLAFALSVTGDKNKGGSAMGDSIDTSRV